MTTSSKPTTKRAARVAATWDAVGSPDGLDPVEQLAHGIVTERSDLRPSVERIMNASLSADGRQRALTLFADSLHRVGDPSRDPRVAIEQCMEDPPSESPT